MPEIPAQWTESERWVWEQIAAGSPADLNTRGPDQTKLDPRTDKGWGEKRRLSARFLETILTQRAFVQATSYGGVRILGALIDDAPLNLEHARLQRLFWLEQSRILIDVRCRDVRIDGDLSLEQCFVAAAVDLNGADIRSSTALSGATFEGAVSLNFAKIGSNLQMNGSTFEGSVSLNRAMVDGSAFLTDGATFKDDVGLGSAKIGTDLQMSGSTFEGAVSLNFAKIGSNLQMNGSTFEGSVSLNGAMVDGSAFLTDGATFKGDVDLISAKIGSNLEMSGSIFEGSVSLTGCAVTGNLLLSYYSEDSAARWGDGASLTLGNTHVGEFQDWWQDQTANSWPKTYQLEGFTYDRLGSIGVGKEADMMERPVSSYVEWLNGDPGSSPQPYEHLAHRFHEAGDPHKATEVRYAARERRRRKAWSKGEWLRALGLWALRLTIGYGLGNRYFYVLWWVLGLTLLGTFVLLFFGPHPVAQWPRAFYASLDQLLPIITLDKAHDAMITGDCSANPCPVTPQSYGVLVYFYWHKIAGWVLGSFLVAGLAGLTQRN